MNDKRDRACESYFVTVKECGNSICGSMNTPEKWTVFSIHKSIGIGNDGNSDILVKVEKKLISLLSLLFAWKNCFLIQIIALLAIAYILVSKIICLKSYNFCKN